MIARVLCCGRAGRSEHLGSPERNQGGTSATCVHALASASGCFESIDVSMRVCLGSSRPPFSRIHSISGVDLSQNDMAKPSIAVSLAHTGVHRLLGASHSSLHHEEEHKVSSTRLICGPTVPPCRAQCACVPWAAQRAALRVGWQQPALRPPRGDVAGAVPHHPIRNCKSDVVTPVAHVRSLLVLLFFSALLFCFFFPSLRRLRQSFAARASLRFSA